MDKFELHQEIEALAADLGMHPEDNYEALLEILWQEKGEPVCPTCQGEGCDDCHGSGAAF